MSESALVKFVSIVNCANGSVLFTFADNSIRKAFKDEYEREVN
jgi:hypothetical protein